MTSGDRQAQLLDQLADFVLANGLDAASLRPMAKAAGTSDRMLLYYFADKNALITAVLGHLAQRMVATLEAQRAPQPLPLDALRKELLAIVLAEDVWPFMRLWLEIAARAARGHALYRPLGEQIGRGFLAWAQGQLRSADPKRDAATLLMTVEGAVLLKSLGLDDVVSDGV
jgi:AcrR family transcriptional regulator